MKKATMNPSTYQQVRENMNRIAEFIGEGGQIDITLEEIIQQLTSITEQIENILKVIQPEPGGGGDLVPDEDGNLQVYGITLVTQFATTDILPSAYTRDVTFELKKFSAIGLSGVEGFSREYGIVVTYRYNLPNGESADPFKYRPQQIAYGDMMSAYARVSADDLGTAWGDWSQVIGAGGSGSISFVDQKTEPDADDQKEGDYWFKEIT